MAEQIEDETSEQVKRANWKAPVTGYSEAMPEVTEETPPVDTEAQEVTNPSNIDQEKIDKILANAKDKIQTLLAEKRPHGEKIDIFDKEIQFLLKRIQDKNSQEQEDLRRIQAIIDRMSDFAKDWYIAKYQEIQSSYEQERAETKAVIALIEEEKNKLQMAPLKSEPEAIEPAKEEEKEIVEEASQDEQKEQAQTNETNRAKEFAYQEKIQEINRQARLNQEKADSYARVFSRMRSDIRDLSPRVIYAPMLNQFSDQFIDSNRARMGRILELSDRFKQAEKAFADNNPDAEIIYNQINDELKTEWHSFRISHEESLEALHRSLRRLEELNNGIDPDEPLMKIYRGVRQIGDDFHSNRLRLLGVNEKTT